MHKIIILKIWKNKIIRLLFENLKLITVFTNSAQRDKNYKIVNKNEKYEI